ASRPGTARASPSRASSASTPTARRSTSAPRSTPPITSKPAGARGSRRASTSPPGSSATRTSASGSGRRAGLVDLPWRHDDRTPENRDAAVARDEGDGQLVPTRRDVGNLEAVAAAVRLRELREGLDESRPRRAALREPRGTELGTDTDLRDAGVVERPAHAPRARGHARALGRDVDEPEGRRDQGGGLVEEGLEPAGGGRT